MPNKWKSKCLLTDEQTKIYGICTQWYVQQWKKKQTTHTSQHRYIAKMVYSWPLNNMASNYMGLLVLGLLSIVNTTVLHNPQLVKPVEVEPQRNCRYGAPTVSHVWIFWLNGESVLLTLLLFKDQLYLVREVSHKGFICMYF